MLFTENFLIDPAERICLCMSCLQHVGGVFISFQMFKTCLPFEDTCHMRTRIFYILGQHGQQEKLHSTS